jgi:protein phosphatase
MVVKPLKFVSTTPKGLVQPAVKCRGQEYLRIIYPTFRTSNWHIEYFNEAIGFPEVADRALSQ